MANKDCKKFGKKIDELNSISIGNVMETEIGKKFLVNCCNSPNSPKFFYHQCFLLYGIKDQIIVEGLINDCTIEDMLQEVDLTLATTTAK